MMRISAIIKKREGLAKTVHFMKEVKTIYDHQLVMLCKNILYQVNGNEKLKKIFAIKMAQEQKIIWTAKCLEEYNYNIGKDKNNWIKMAIKILNEEDIYLCNHEIRDKIQITL